MSEIRFHALGAVRARSGEDPLVPFLLNARGARVTISARDVARIDSHRLQVLMVARAQWAGDGVSFTVTDVSPTFAAGLERLGLAGDYFDKEVGA